jgi:hypothetical protein
MLAGAVILEQPGPQQLTSATTEQIIEEERDEDFEHKVDENDA